jgi:hypothetical protein
MCVSGAEGSYCVAFFVTFCVALGLQLVLLLDNGERLDLAEISVICCSNELTQPVIEAC